MEATEISPAEAARIMLRDDAATAALGIELLEIDAGHARVSMSVRPDMVNGWGSAHGGFVSALADSAFALACNSYGVVTVASGFSIDFLEPGRVGDTLVADAVEVVRHGRSGVYDVTISRDDTVIATFRGRSRSQGRPIEKPSSS